MTKSQKKNAKRRQKNKATNEETTNGTSSSEPVEPIVNHTEQLAPQATRGHHYPG